MRSALKLSGAEFAEKVGISQGYLSDIENNKASVNKTLLLALSYIYKFNYDYLVSGKGDPFVNEQLYEIQEKDVYKELLVMTREVLASGTDCSTSLAANIRSFHKSVEMQKSSSDKKEDSDDRTKRLEEKCDQLIDEIGRLKKRMDKINSTGEAGPESKERKAI